MRRALSLAPAAVATALAFFTHGAAASVSVAVTWDALLHESSAAVLATPVEARSAWENGRIYTYTHVHVDRTLAGTLAPGADAWVRTMGGTVGDVGQIVDGEAVLTLGRTSLFFLHPGPAGAFVVTARGQGQFPLVTEAGSTPHLVRNTSAGAIVPSRAPARASVPLAVEMVHGRVVDDVAQDVATAWPHTHP